MNTKVVWYTTECSLFVLCDMHLSISHDPRLKKCKVFILSKNDLHALQMLRNGCSRLGKTFRNRDVIYVKSLGHS